MTIGATVPYWSVILGQQGGLGEAVNAGLEITAATGDDFLEAQRQLMAGLADAEISMRELRQLAMAAIRLKEVLSGESTFRVGVVVAHRADLVKGVLRGLDSSLRDIDPARFSQGVAAARQNHGFGLAAGARLFVSGETAAGSAERPFITKRPCGSFPNPVFYRRVDEIGLPVRAVNCLLNVNIVYLFQLVQETAPGLLKIKNLHKRSLRKIEEALERLGLSLGMPMRTSPSVAEIEAYRTTHPDLFEKK